MSNYDREALRGFGERVIVGAEVVNGTGDVMLFARQHDGEDSHSVILHFTPDQWDDQTSSMAFTCATDERSHTYLLPVGCCPGWVWRSRIISVTMMSVAASEESSSPFSVESNR